MERCPCCTARLAEATQCQRCQADLSAAINAEQAAKHWLSKAIQLYQDNEIEQSLHALEHSLRLHKTRLALLFREFLIARQCKIIVDFLAAKQLQAAAQRLYKVRLLLPHSLQLRQLRSFTEFLLVAPQELRFQSSAILQEETAD